MARLRNSHTGVVVNVSDETAARLASRSHTASGAGEWRSDDDTKKKPEPKRAPAKKSAEKPSDD